MVRLFGVIIPDTDKVLFGLTKLYGIGWVNGAAALKKAGLTNDKRMKDLTEEQLKKLTLIIEKDGKVVQSMEGVTDLSTLEKLLKPLVD